MKFCTNCQSWKDRADFNRDRKTPDGHHSQCRTCKNAISLRWRAQNPEKCVANAKAYRARHPVRCALRAREFYQRNPNRPRDFLAANPKMKECARLLALAIRRGDWSKAQTQTCLLADETCLGVMNWCHTDYEDWTHCIALCKSHHVRWDSKQPKAE